MDISNRRHRQWIKTYTTKIAHDSFEVMLLLIWPERKTANRQVLQQIAMDQFHNKKEKKKEKSASVKRWYMWASLYIKCWQHGQCLPLHAWLCDNMKNALQNSICMVTLVKQNFLRNKFIFCLIDWVMEALLMSD